MTAVGEQIVVIGTDGEVQFLWNDDLEPLCAEGRVSVARVADVEPATDGGWMVDCRRIGFGQHGPFSLRATALAVERTFVEGQLSVGRLEVRK